MDREKTVEDTEASQFGFRAGSDAGPLSSDLRDALLAQERLRGTILEDELRSSRPIHEAMLWLSGALVIWLCVAVFY